MNYQMLQLIRPLQVAALATLWLYHWIPVAAPGAPFHVDFVAFSFSFGAMSCVCRQLAANDFARRDSDMQHHASGQTLLPHRDVACFQL